MFSKINKISCQKVFTFSGDSQYGHLIPHKNPYKKGCTYFDIHSLRQLDQLLQIYSMDRSFLLQLFFVCILPGGQHVTNIAQYAPIRVRAYLRTTSALRDVRVTLQRPVESIQKPGTTRNYFSYHRITSLTNLQK